MFSKSCSDADHAEGLYGNPSSGGGPEQIIGSAAVGFLFEFAAAHPGGGFEKSTAAMVFVIVSEIDDFCCDTSETIDSGLGDLGGLPRRGL